MWGFWFGLVLLWFFVVLFYVGEFCFVLGFFCLFFLVVGFVFRDKFCLAGDFFSFIFMTSIS